MKGVAILFSAIAVVLVSAAPPMFDDSLDEFWGSFKSLHNKEYGDTEEYIRRATWEKNLRFIRKHNLEADLGMHTFRVGMNEHGDLTDEEYEGFLKGFKPSNSTRGSTFLEVEDFEASKTVDWREKGYVTPVKNQMQCGSCWAFSATGSLEGQHFKKSKKLVSLSEQNLVDCAMKYGTHGCGGGTMDAAFEYVKANDGIDTEMSYPYTAKNGICHFKKSSIGATDTGFMNIPHGDEDALRKAVATVGPISVAIDASKPTFRFYKSGVYTDSDCSSTQLDHGVLAVGYGKKGRQAYWIVKNSWGTTWGDEGYIWMRRNHDNMCGIASMASYPLV